MSEWAEQLNRDCVGLSIDEEKLSDLLATSPETEGLYQSIREKQPNLFSRVPVFVGREHLEFIQQTIYNIDKVVHLDSFQSAVLETVPNIARVRNLTHGAFLGFDFHVSKDGPKLIEINTNAGGPLLNLALAKAQKVCCNDPLPLRVFPRPLEAIEGDFMAMFREEWQSMNTKRQLRNIAIVDESPKDQYMYPEFLLFKDSFQRAGLAAYIADPKEFQIKNNTLWLKDIAIDLVYNRLTDFYFVQPSSAVLKEAYDNNYAVVTPNPRAHALYANKKNFVILSDNERLKQMGVPESIRTQFAQSIPKTIIVQQEQADVLWQERKTWFFKPFWGYGSKAAYRGDKLTRSTWQEILASGYVAQRIVPPSERTIKINEQLLPLKLDLRAYVYKNAVQLFAARLYQGQTTNFRTLGGGFAPVFTN